MKQTTNTQDKNILPKKLNAELSFNLAAEPEMGKPFKVYFKTEWLSSESKQGKFYLLSTAGCGGSVMVFQANGKTYEVDMKPVFRQLIEQVI
ncbi:MAG: hypothetical protein V4547_18785 [Bacteroidota bacterium]